MSSCRIREYVAAHGWMGVVARTLVGLVFVFAAVVKAMDPYGTVLKIEEYMTAIGWMPAGEIATVGAVGLVAVEMLVGCGLLLGAAQRVVALAALIINSLFMVLTLWAAIYAPVAECGCFGDVLSLTNWQSFAKNVVLVVLSVVALWSVRSTKWAVGRLVGALVGCVAVVALAIYSLILLPPVEKFPFGEGVNLPKAIAEELMASQEENYVICRSKSTGEERRFLAGDSEWWDENEWEFVEAVASKAESRRVGARDFRLYIGAMDITAQILDLPMCRLVCVENVERLTVGTVAKLQRVAQRCLSLGNRVVVVTASPLKQAELYFPNMEMCNMDAVTMRALLRGRAGIVTLREGTVEHKATVWGVAL